MGRIIFLLVLAAAVYLLLRPSSRAKVGRYLLPVAAVLLALAYLRSPIDLIPDVSPVGLLDDILVLLSALWWANQRLGGARQRTQESDEQREYESPTYADHQDVGWDPYSVLGIERGASREEIIRAYRELMKQYHPDRVAGLGEELQKLAHEKTVEIQRAYEELT